VDRRTRNVFAIGLIVVVVASGAMALFASGGGRPGASPGAQTVDGVVVAVDAQGLDAVRAFTLRQSDGMIALLVVGDLENGASFPPGRLVEHQATGQPIRVWYRTDGDIKVAYRIEDAT
jgi:hypothetical protein